MVNKDNPMGLTAVMPGFAPEVAGAPAALPGGNDGSYKTKMSGKPTSSAVIAPSFSPDIAGAPGAGGVLQVPKADDEATARDNGGETKGVAATDTDMAPTTQLTDEERERAEAERERAEAVAGTDRRIRTLQEWLDAEENRPETPEERRKRERMEKSKKVVAAISDGLSALSNLYFTSQYAPNMYSHEKSSQMAATNSRIEQLKAERAKKKDQYMNISLKLGELEDERARTIRDLEAQQEARKIARQKAEDEAKKAEFERSLWDDKRREQTGKANKAEQEAITAKAVADYAPQMQQAKLKTEKARKGSYEASAAHSYASAAKATEEAKTVNQFYAWDRHGNKYAFRTEEAALAFAEQQGTLEEKEVEETTETMRTSEGTSGKKSTISSQTSKKTKQGYAAKPDPTGMDDPTA